MWWGWKSISEAPTATADIRYEAEQCSLLSCCTVKNRDPPTSSFQQSEWVDTKTGPNACRGHRLWPDHHNCTTKFPLIAKVIRNTPLASLLMSVTQSSSLDSLHTVRHVGALLHGGHEGFVLRLMLTEQGSRGEDSPPGLVLLRRIAEFVSGTHQDPLEIHQICRLPNNLRRESAGFRMHTVCAIDYVVRS